MQTHTHQVGAARGHQRCVWAFCEARKLRPGKCCRRGPSGGNKGEGRGQPRVAGRTGKSETVLGLDAFPPNSPRGKIGLTSRFRSPSLTQRSRGHRVDIWASGLVRIAVALPPSPPGPPSSGPSKRQRNAAAWRRNESRMGLFTRRKTVAGTFRGIDQSAARLRQRGKGARV